MAESSRRSLEKGLASIVVGLVAAAVVIIALEPSLRRFYPVSDVHPLTSPEQYGRMTASLPALTYFLLWSLYAIASLVGGAASSLTFGRTRSWPPLTTGLVLMIAGTFGVWAVYQPLWFHGVSFLAYPMAYLGHLAVRKAP